MSRVEQTTTENKTKGQIVSVFCLLCQRPTRHLVLQSIDKMASQYDHSRDEHSVIDWGNNYQIIECQGCEEASFRHTDWFSEEEGESERLYPKRTANRLPLKALLYVPPTLRRLYRETIDALNFDALTLCATGLRALVEGLCAEQGVKKGSVTIIKNDGTQKTIQRTNLEGKIAGLAERHILTAKHADILHEHRFLGNEAVHQLSQPSVAELILAIQIVEHTLDALYEIPETATQLRDKRKRRSKKKK